MACQSHLKDTDAVIGRNNIMDDRLVVIDVQYIDSYGGVGTAWLLSSVTSLNNQLITIGRGEVKVHQ